MKSKIKTYPKPTEEQLMAAIENAVRGLAHSFVFGYYALEDIKQEIRAFCLKAAPLCTPGRKLDSYLFIAARHHLINLQRNKLFRNEPPCLLCHQGNQKEHPDGEVCQKYVAWLKRNNTKKNLVTPVPIDLTGEDQEPLGCQAREIELKEIREKIDDELPSELRPFYLRYLAGEKLTRLQYNLLVEKLKEILKHEDNCF